MADASGSPKTLSPNERRGRRLFTAGAILLIVMGLVHSLSLIKGPVASNETERQLLDLMSNYKLDLLGSMRSMENLMTGFSISFMFAALGFGALDIVLRRERTQLIKRIALVNAVWLAAMTAVSLRYFFAVPTSFLAAALLIFLLATIILPGTETDVASEHR
jgi:uncharacterized membrane protein